MRALSILQPWAWLIANGYKPPENRSWNTNFRGDFLIHAGKGFDQAGYDWVRETFPDIPLPGSDGHRGRAKGAFERGGIVGRGTLSHVVAESESPWFFGPYGFWIVNPQPLSFRPCRGKLGFFVPEVMVGEAP